MAMKVLYRDEQTVHLVDVFSPSARKPAIVVRAWQEVFGALIELATFRPLDERDFHAVHDRAYVRGVFCLAAANGFGTRSHLTIWRLAPGAPGNPGPDGQERNGPGIEGEMQATMLLSTFFEVRAMKLTIAVVSAALLSLTTPATAQTDEEVTGALSNLQYEMSRCIAYYVIVQECVQKDDPNLGAETAKVTAHLIDFSVQIGNAIGMTEDAMASRVTAEQGQMRSMIQNNCVNIHSLYVRHAMRCKQVVENGDSVLTEYLGTKQFEHQGPK